MDQYRATEIRSGIQCVDFVASDQCACAISPALDPGRGICTALEAELPTEAEATVPLIERVARSGGRTGVEARFLSGMIDAPFGRGADRHADTVKRIGERIEYTRRRSQCCERLHLNRQVNTWPCLAGCEQGLPDTDHCRHLRVADRLYLFVWREKFVPRVGAVLVDLKQMKTTGKIFGSRSFAARGALRPLLSRRGEFGSGSWLAPGTSSSQWCFGPREPQPTLGARPGS